MKVLSRIRGPRLSTKLMLLGLALLIVPWLSYQQLLDMEDLLIQTRQNVQLLLAKGISTLFNGRDDVFDDLPVRVEEYEPLYADPLKDPIRLDGRINDWNSIKQDFHHFGETNADGSFSLLIGDRNEQLYVYMLIKDDERVFRKPGHLALDTADHVRISFIGTDGEDGRVSLTLHGPGVATAYYMDPEWRFASTGAPTNDVYGSVVETSEGYAIEFRLPLSILGSTRNFALSFVDVDPITNQPNSSSIEQTTTGITQTLPKSGKESFDLVVFRSAEALNIIQGLGFAEARILVIDARRNLRAETGSIVPSDTETNKIRTATRDWFNSIRPFVHQLFEGEPWSTDDVSRSEEIAGSAITAALNGEPGAVLRQISENTQIITAYHPIVSTGGKVLGAIIVERNIDEILTFQRAALEQTLMVSLASLLVVLIVLFAFSGRLAWRIRHLRREAAAAIDASGRLKANRLTREVNAADEIGDLARGIDNMLSRIDQHNTFLENMPRTLRHEINNPLNTLSTSLQHLEQDSGLNGKKYLESAKRGLFRIGSIVQNLADAANLEESLNSEEREVVDIQALLESYVNNCQMSHPEQTFVFRGHDAPVYANVADYRIEQLMDKVIDNAIDFHRSNSAIKVQLDKYKDHLQITVANRGPVLPHGEGDSLFESMVTHRGRHNRLHFGLGLFVVRVIAEYHGGSALALNLSDGSGVAVVVQLPLEQNSSFAVEKRNPSLDKTSTNP